MSRDTEKKIRSEKLLGEVLGTLAGGMAGAGAGTLIGSQFALAKHPRLGEGIAGGATLLGALAGALGSEEHHREVDKYLKHPKDRLEAIRHSTRARAVAVPTLGALAASTVPFLSGPELIGKLPAGTKKGRLLLALLGPAAGFGATSALSGMYAHRKATKGRSFTKSDLALASLPALAGSAGYGALLASKHGRGVWKGLSGRGKAVALAPLAMGLGVIGSAAMARKTPKSSDVVYRRHIADALADAKKAREKKSSLQTLAEYLGW